jgi:hypothetical protein
MGKMGKNRDKIRSKIGSKTREYQETQPKFKAEMTGRLLDRYTKFCPYILKEHYTSNQDTKMTRKKTQKICKDNEADRQNVLVNWKFALDELWALEARIRELKKMEGCKHGVDAVIKEAMRVEREKICEDRLKYREEIQYYKEIWPLFVFSWDES